MTLTPQLQKLWIKKRVSRLSSIRESDIDFRKLVVKLEKVEITMELEAKKEVLKLRYVNNNHTTTSQVNNIHDSDTELAKKITQKLNIYEKKPNFKGKSSFKNDVIIDVDMYIASLKVDKNNKISRTNHRNIESQKNSFISIIVWELFSRTIITVKVFVWQKRPEFAKHKISL